ncbi:cytochrome P450 [Microdochium trichocladiopsis]|uniref:Cytochrome P450 n=1 Tax=Microdochium trichocladiopsis TaxID=1682393 RepID=A0A9P8YFM5_9PEZI|nr:cytochrome P450 [Microdochium trichocladiopsis]KAH7037110.1 cytochrome P450 [Microdochium trichocladiopsis]
MMAIVEGLWRTALALMSAYVTVTVVEVFTNPLRSIPGPWYSLWTDIVLKYYILRGQKARYVQALHQRYGPVVRMSPEQADICDLAALSQIGRAEFHKTAYYKTMTIDEDNVFNTGDPALHRRQRRLLSAPLSESGLKSVVNLVDEKVKLAMQRIDEEMTTGRGDGAADVMKWTGFMATDTIAELTFGESFQMLEEGRKHQYFRDMESAAPVLALRALFPFFRKMMSLGVPVPGANKAMLMMQRLRAGAEDRLERHRHRVEEEEARGAPVPTPTLFTKLHDATGGEKGLTQEEILSNAQLYLVAGSDTTSNVLTYVIWNLCKRPEVKEKLLAELRSLPGTQVTAGGAEIQVDYQELRSAAYLNAVIDETLRLYPSIPAPLPRHVPPEGMALAGHWFPGGTVVSTQAWSFHMDESIFPQPDKFDPERWEKPTKEMREGFVPFGSGVRICLGLHLAMMELRLATARFFLKYPDAKVSDADGMSDADMEQIAFFMAFPKGKRCLIQGR